MKQTTKSKEIELYYVDGVRHHAVVLARSEAEAMKLAKDATNPAVLVGRVDDWEAPEAEKMKLPRGWKIVQS